MKGPLGSDNDEGVWIFAVATCFIYIRDLLVVTSVCLIA